MRAAIEGLLRELDSYSQYFDEEGLRQLRQDTTGRFAGLGITVGIKDHYPVVIAPMEGTPAKRAGLLPGDLIVAIEGEDAFDLSLEEVVNTLRGEPGSVVRITVARPGHSQWDVVITARAYQDQECCTHRYDPASDRLHQHEADEILGRHGFRGRAGPEEAEFEWNGSTVLDLRGNPGDC